MALGHEQVINRLFRDSLKADVSLRNFSVPSSLSDVILWILLKAKMLCFRLRKLPQFSNSQVDL